jgi:hypothetical protein
VAVPVRPVPCVDKCKRGIVRIFLVCIYREGMMVEHGTYLTDTDILVPSSSLEKVTIGYEEQYKE